VQTQAVNGELGTSTWTEQATRTGDGTAVVTLNAGFYWFRVVSTFNNLSALSNLVYVHVTEGSEAVLYQCLDAVRSRIQGLSLAGVQNDQVVIGKVPDDKNRSFPSILITPFQSESLNAADGTNSRDDLGYPVLVAILAADNQDQQANLDTYLVWREKIRQAFHNQRLPGVSEIITTAVEPRNIVEPAAWFERNLFVSGLLLRFLSREPRGI
jgi:hypothetical protein